MCNFARADFRVPLLIIWRENLQFIPCWLLRGFYMTMDSMALDFHIGHLHLTFYSLFPTSACES
uniref:Uncharacterized protein n=1 Tax=Rhizophora mucronata TaxID=61149 RepID=A0A2P2NMD0_RHIMU